MRPVGLTVPVPVDSISARRTDVKATTRRNMQSALKLALVLSCLTVHIFADQTLSAREAAKHVGEQATVCGVVASAHYAARSKGQPTFLNLDEPYPNPIFTVLIWGEDRPKFGEPEVRFRDKRICAAGVIRLYRDAAEIVAREPSQLRLEK